MQLAAFCEAGRDCLLVRGALGDPAFQDDFAAMEAGWREAAERAGDVRVQAVKAKAELQAVLSGIQPADAEELWIVLIGHGTDDGRSAKFNLEGEDVSAAELAAWLEPWTKPLVVVHCASASGPFIPALSGKDRVVVTATQSGTEVFAPKFGRHLARVLFAPEADLDRDGAVSILEAAVVAADRVAVEYESENKLATEHALVDDNGDGKGTRADWFEGLKLARQPQQGTQPDGERAVKLAFVRGQADRNLTAEQRRRRDDLERGLGELKRQRETLEEGEFFRRAEEILLELGRLNRAALEGAIPCKAKSSG